ncbi:family 20 glycosylhydrolase [Rubrolithibacter danxiaensis]|uniref:family 20 glycosylhydrolase n=1 Tax=Rubrolithibacter danxiaensis TaxID=3390805 RepID=UPI003BF91459
MLKSVSAILLLFLSAFTSSGQEKLDSILPVRGFCIVAPRSERLPQFIDFINKELGPRKVNTLILRVDFNYRFKSHPELRDSNALSKRDVKKIVEACAKNKIKVIPQINLLGHQSWAETVYNLLRVYPQFDETPHVKMPAKYTWPNEDKLYCKSYCPLHPEVHKVVFDLMDEICDVFETDAFHAGMDEVFYIGDEKCPRCQGRDKAELFAGEVSAIRNHLALSNRKLWIWGDRLIDGKTTGLGEWEASFNNTYRAVDLIPKDVMICDWHYERPDKTPVYFAVKGLNVAACPWRKPEVAIAQLNDMLNSRKESSEQIKNRMQGVIQTVWSDSGRFLDGFYNNKKDDKGGDETEWNCFRKLFDEINKLN